MNTTTICQLHCKGGHPTFAVAHLIIRDFLGEPQPLSAATIQAHLDAQRHLIADLATKQNAIVLKEFIHDVRSIRIFGGRGPSERDITRYTSANDITVAFGVNWADPRGPRAYATSLAG